MQLNLLNWETEWAVPTSSENWARPVGVEFTQQNQFWAKLDEGLSISL